LRGFALNRGTAAAVLKEIVRFCPEIGQKDVEMPATFNAPEGVKAIYIAYIPEIEALTCIRKIVQDYKLTLRQEKDRIVIFEPHVD
jgi:hypothetical protein